MRDKSREEFEEWYANMFDGTGYDEAVATFEKQQKKIERLEAENAALKRNQENSVKMFKELLLMLDKVAEK